MALLEVHNLTKDCPYIDLEGPREIQRLKEGEIYGLAIGEMFFGESMFSRVADASKVALIALCRWLRTQDFGLLDCQVGNAHLFSMGAIELQRTVFEQLLEDLVEAPDLPGSWTQGFRPDERW